MRKLTLTKCKICGEEVTARGFSQHISRVHNMPLKEYIIQYELDGKEPLCKCGCGQPTTINGYQIMDYKNHHSGKTGFRKGESPKRDYDKWIKNLTKSVREYNKRAKEENPDYRSGKNNNYYGRHHTKETKELLKQKTEEQIANGTHPFIGNINGRVGKSSLEEKFEKFLIENNVNYKHNYKIGYLPKDKKALRFKYYDFYLPERKTLIELHGSYWHPKELTENLSETQVKNYHNDIFKKQLATEKGYTLEVVYDTELESYMSKVVECL